MHIAVDARCLDERATSNRTYWYELLRALSQSSESFKCTLLSPKPIAGGPWEADPRFEHRVLPGRWGRWWSIVSLPREAKRIGADVTHVQYTVSPLFKTPVLTTIHDVSFFIEPRWFSIKDGTLLRATIPPSSRRAQRVIAVSQSSKVEIMRYCGVEADHVAVTPLAAGDAFRPMDRSEAERIVFDQLKIKPPYILSVGSLTSRKNWRLAVVATAAARRMVSADLHLVFTGNMRTELGQFKHLVERHNASSWVHTVGPVSVELLRALYCASDELLHPSLHEGFGLTPLEAMACGTPVVASNRAAIPEVVGGAGVLLPPGRPEEWAEALLAAREPVRREELIQLGLERAKGFSWSTTAQLTLNAYRATANTPTS